MCESRGLVVQMSACMQANCTMADGLTVAKVQASLCQYPHPDKKDEGKAEQNIMFCIAVIAVLLRLVARALAGEFFVEDYIITVAIVCPTAPSQMPLYPRDLVANPSLAAFSPASHYSNACPSYAEYVAHSPRPFVFFSRSTLY